MNYNNFLKAPIVFAKTSTPYLTIEKRIVSGWFFGYLNQQINIKKFSNIAQLIQTIVKHNKYSQDMSDLKFKK